MAILTDYYASRYGWRRGDIENEDFWFVIRDYPEAARRREALQKLTDAVHLVETRGPEGEQDVRDEKGKKVKGGMRVSYLGYRKYVRKLLDDAGMIDAELEDMVDELKATDAKFTKLGRVMGRLNN